MVLSLLDVIEHWSTQSPSTRTWAVSVLLVALTGFLWGFTRRSPRTKSPGAVAVTVGNGRNPACPPELLKDDLSLRPRSGNGVVNGLTFDREISVPFEVGDVRVSKILVHPIKVSPFGQYRHM